MPNLLSFRHCRAIFRGEVVYMLPPYPVAVPQRHVPFAGPAPILLPNLFQVLDLLSGQQPSAQ